MFGMCTGEKELAELRGVDDEDDGAVKVGVSYIAALMTLAAIY